MADVALQRKNMVESQVRPNDVTDRRLLRALADVPREAFLPTALKPIAYIDEALPLVKAEDGNPARGLMAPRDFAKLLQLAEIAAGDVVLDLGAGCGYSTAVIARLAQTVVALETDERLVEMAMKSIESACCDNAALVTGDLDVGYPTEAPYDVIVVEGATDAIPPALLDQLKDGGRLVTIEAGLPGHAVVWRRLGRNFDRRVAHESAAPPLPGFQNVPAFVF